MERMIDLVDSTVCGIRLSDRSMNSVGYPDAWHVSRFPPLRTAVVSRVTPVARLSNTQNNTGRTEISSNWGKTTLSRSGGQRCVLLALQK